MGNFYQINIDLTKEELIEKMLNHENFIVEEGTGYFDQQASASRMMKVFVTKIDDNKYQISENAGLGGMFQLIGDMYFSKSINKTTVSINYTMGVMNYYIPIFIAFIVLIFGSIFLFDGENVVGFLGIAISGIVFLWWLSKRYMISVFNKNIANAWNIKI